MTLIAYLALIWIACGIAAWVIASVRDMLLNDSGADELAQAVGYGCVGLYIVLTEDK